MNTRAASILIAGGGLIFLCGTLAMKAQHTGACLQARIYARECRQMTLVLLRVAWELVQLFGWTGMAQ